MPAYKQLLIFCTVLIISCQNILSQETHENEENEESIIVGFGPTLEFNDSLYGINTRLYYGTDETFCFGSEISYFPFQNIENEIDKSILDLNINAHYIIELSKKIGLYPLSGLNYSIEKERYSNDTHKETALGLNYGLGTHYKINDLYIFTEFKGIIGQLNTEFFTLGIIFNFNIHYKQ